MRLTALAVAVLALSACGPEDVGEPVAPLEVAYGVEGESPDCPGAAMQWETLVGGATYRAQWCVWQCAMFDGAPVDEAVVAFRLEDGATTWDVVAVGTRDLPGACP